MGAIRENVRDRQRKAEEAIKAGKDAARQARSDLEARVAESKAAYRAALAEGPSADVDGEDGEEEADIAPAAEDDEEGDRESPE